MSTLTPEMKKFFLKNGYLHLKNALPDFYVNDVLKEANIIFKKNNIIDFSKEYSNSFMRFNFGRERRFFNNKKKYDKKHFKNIYSICEDIFKTKNFSISGLDNRIFCGLKSTFSDEEKRVKTPYWHIDGWNNYHFLNIKYNAMPILFSFSDTITSGGTMIIPSSIKYICELLYKYPEGIHPDSLGGYSYIIPYILDKCSDKDIHQLKLEKGDAVFMHPFLLHKASVNTSNTPKLINNNHVQLANPISFVKKYDDLSLIEKSIHNSLNFFNLDCKSFLGNNVNKFTKPPMARNNAEKNIEFLNLKKEMQKLKNDGIITPAWANSFNYLSNIKDEKYNRDKISKYSFTVRKR